MKFSKLTFDINNSNHLGKKIEEEAERLKELKKDTIQLVKTFKMISFVSAGSFAIEESRDADDPSGLGHRPDIAFTRKDTGRTEAH